MKRLKVRFVLPNWIAAKLEFVTRDPLKFVLFKLVLPIWVNDISPYLLKDFFVVAPCGIVRVTAVSWNFALVLLNVL